MTTDDANIVWTTSDPDNLVIELTTDALYHINVERDRDIDGIESHIKVTVETPNMVVQSLKYPDTRIYSKFGILEGTYSGFWFHTSVSFQGMFGRVTSAYPSEKEKLGKILRVYYKS